MGEVSADVGRGGARLRKAFAVCGNFEPEVRAVLGEEDPSGGPAALLAFPATCGRPPLVAEAIRDLCESVRVDGWVEVIGGPCVAGLRDFRGPLTVHGLRQCFHLVAPPALVDHLLASGAFLVTPGWLAHWRARLEQMGIDEATAPALFGESMRRVVLLDTGADPGCAEWLREFAAFVGLPAETVPVGLEHLRLKLGELVSRGRLEEERAESLAELACAQRRAADHAAAIDLLSTLTEISGERQAIERSLDVFQMLFAPRRATFVSVEGGEPSCSVSQPPREVGAAALLARLLRAGSERLVGADGFLLPVKHLGELLGLVEVEGVAAPDHLEGDLALALTAAGISGLAIANARKFERIQRDVSAERQMERERESAIQFLGLVNSSAGVAALVRAATAFFHERSGCEAVGIRLKEGEDYPYAGARGFPEEFVRLESHLCDRDASGAVRRDIRGDPVLECMCGNVLCGRVDPTKPFFTTSGSFWTASTSRLLASTTDADRQTRTRNRCRGEGYESVALLPLRAGSEVFGLLQLNDRREGMFDPEGIALWERLAGYLAVALARARADEERGRAEKELRAVNARLVEADLRKNEFLAVLSHELRNPLAPIRNSVYILERAAPGGERANRALEVIERQVQHMARLVDDLLDVTRISRGKVHLKCERVELDRIVRGACEDLRELFRASGLELCAAVADEPLVVDGDPTRLAQVTSNLLQNAAKFARQGGRAWLTLAPGEGGQAVLQVRDDGAGIERDLLPAIFEPFVQADRTLDRSRGGLGLGLALVKGFVELHGGSVSAESEGPGRGALFTVRLPIDARETRAPALAPAGERAGPPRRVLVVEDNADAARSLVEALELVHHRVEVAFDGPSGIERAHAFAPDVVLCDIGLPGLDGYGVARAMRADPALRSVYLVALSGYAAPEDVERSIEAGFDLHMPKPPDLEALERVFAGVAASPATCRPRLDLDQG
jgi:signal transduction histidine kinase/ActR/RegA family two-component response regulator